MAYFSPSIDSEGIHVATYDDVLEYLIERYKAVFGADIYLGVETKDYQMLSIFAKCISDFGQLCVDNYNARNPNYATGNSLDLLLPLVSMTRRGATYSTAILKVTGTEDAVVPAGSQAMDSNGNLWSLDAAVTIGESGTEVAATCVTPGKVEAPAGTIVNVFTVVEGWSGVTNEADATPGKDAETDEEVRIRRKQMVGVINNGTYDAMVRKLLDISGVEYVNVISNDTGSASNGIAAHSICCVVDGGSDDDVAEAIWKGKAPGIGTSYGSAESTYQRAITYVDDYNHSNTVNFARPKPITVDVTVTITPLAGYDSTRCQEVIETVLKETIDSLGIGETWVVTTAYRDIYNAFYGQLCPFVINSVTGNSQSGQVTCSYCQKLKAGTITISDS